MKTLPGYTTMDGLMRRIQRVDTVTLMRQTQTMTSHAKMAVTLASVVQQINRLIERIELLERVEDRNCSEQIAESTAMASMLQQLADFMDYPLNVEAVLIEALNDDEAERAAGDAA
jgi:hypothetical protein